MPEKEKAIRARRIPRSFQPFGCRRTLYAVFERALAITSTMDAERHAILAAAFAYTFEVSTPNFEFALRKYRAGATLREAAEELFQAAKAR
jgi:hypothetical protein